MGLICKGYILLESLAGKEKLVNPALTAIPFLIRSWFASKVTFLNSLTFIPKPHKILLSIS